MLAVIIEEEYVSLGVYILLGGYCAAEAAVAVMPVADKPVAADLDPGVSVCDGFII